ncbi:GNAT family N-acetyltransferase [Fictibacillus fluitans]|uniref:GNAT family protein n=1 Tax=Fictibacillus fluitans TaxID=3058422 RepID=A0ABT8HYH4_9BACL|nr:GNAT family protein [Fictibacillus sp. NE201]MDN4525769.1 GNAT family protein [Fictibacillus sp. NE201]
MSVFEMNLERLYIRDIKPSDAGAIAHWKSDPLFRKMSTGTMTIINEGNQKQDIEKSLGLPNETYVIVAEKKSRRPVGYVRFNWMGSNQRFGWLRFGLGEERGKGYMREALTGIFHHLFQEETHRIDAEVYEYNQRSLHLLDSLGFKKEGTRRLAYYDEDNYYDIHVLGLLESDWRKHQSGSSGRTAVK